jgi:histidinol phosphatase-like PHP family hydrolase
VTVGSHDGKNAAWVVEMIDLHTHSIFSDGELIPAESAQRAFAAGYKIIAITDHVDFSNIDLIIPRIIRVSDRITCRGNIKVIPGVELTHVDPKDIESLTIEARNLGARIVIVHGETITEPVPEGTNMAAIQAGVDILAHPGLIGDREVALAAEKGVYLEITTRRGHAFTNGHVVQMARKHNARLVLNNDAHAPSDFVGHKMAVYVAKGAGLTEKEIDVMFRNSQELVQRNGV